MSAENMTDQEVEKFLEMLRQRGVQLPKQRKPNIVICGQTGVGKTTTINTLFGREVGAVGDFSRGSVTDTLYEWEAHGQYIDIVDLPGLGDTPKNDREYREMYRRRVAEADGFLVVVNPPRPFNSATKSTVDLLISCGVAPEQIVFAYNRLESITTLIEGERRSVRLNGIAGPATEADREAVERARQAFYQDLCEGIHGSRYRTLFSLDQIVPYDALHGWNIFVLLGQVVQRLPGETLASWDKAVSRGVQELQEREREQQLAERELLLRRKEKLLAQEKKALTQLARRLTQRAKKLDKRAEELAEWEQELTEREEALDERERRLSLTSSSQREKTAPPERSSRPQRLTPVSTPEPDPVEDDLEAERRSIQEDEERLKEREKAAAEIPRQHEEHKVTVRERIKNWFSKAVKVGAELAGRAVSYFLQAFSG